MSPLIQKAHTLFFLLLLQHNNITGEEGGAAQNAKTHPAQTRLSLVGARGGECGVKEWIP